MTTKAYYENYWRHRLKTETKLTRIIPLRIKLALAHLPPFPSQILDLGCGEGSLGKAAKALHTGHNLVGVDVSATALKLALPHYNRVLRLDLDTAAPFKEKFDAVTALEIIEHLDRPGRLLDFVFSHLKPAGRLILSFPNTRWWGTKDERPTYTDADHKQRFSLSSITKLLARHGFWVETLDGIFTLPWYFGRLPHSVQKIFGRISPDRFGYQLILVCRQQTARPAVAHLITDYLNPSESWLYTQVQIYRRFLPLVLTRNLKNLDQFPSTALFKYPLLFDSLPPSLLRKTVALIQRVKDRVTQAETNYYRRIIKSSGVRLIHAHYGPTGWKAIGLKQKTGLPLVVSFYGGDAYWLPANFPIWKKRYLKLWPKADAIIVKGPQMKQCLVNLGCPAKKIFILDHGVDLAKIHFKTRRPTRTVKLLTACGLIDYKGVDLVIKAIKNLPTVTLTVAGAGPETPKLKSLIKKLNLRRRVKLIGWIAWSQLIKLALKHHLFIHPSYTSADYKQEGIPTSIIERAASGMPVITTRHADIPEVVQDGVNGYLVPEQDVSTLTERIKFLVNHPQLWEKMGRFGRRLVEKNFDATKQTAKREALYQQLIGKSG